jgi:osmotically-inducible protein OsmY
MTAMKETTTMVQTIIKTDAEIQHAVLGELRWDTRVEETDVGVAVDHGVVTLSGSVSSYAKKVAAQEAAHRVRGVLDVVNDLTVTIPGVGARTDTEIAHAVRRALEWDPLIPDERIQTTVSTGWVTLEGHVDRWSQREDAAHTVRHLMGVQGVTNRITVTAPPIEPDTVRAAIEEALERRADRAAERLQIAVRDGTVTLAGRVRSWSEKQAVLGAAGHAPGVRGIDDQLRIDATL